MCICEFAKLEKINQKLRVLPEYSKRKSAFLSVECITIVHSQTVARGIKSTSNQLDESPH